MCTCYMMSSFCSLPFYEPSWLLTLFPIRTTITEVHSFSWPGTSFFKEGRAGCGLHAVCHKSCKFLQFAISLTQLAPDPIAHLHNNQISTLIFLAWHWLFSGGEAGCGLHAVCHKFLQIAEKSLVLWHI